jgi:hypothetical protein
MASLSYTYSPVSSSTTTTTMSATPTSSASATSTAFVALALGRSANAIDLFVPPAPAVHAAADLKARSFDFLADLLLSHSALYSSAELIAAFNHIPSSSYNAALESDGICSGVRSAFFRVDNLVGLGFRTHLGAPITAAITNDLSTRPSDIYYFAFRSTVTPSDIDARISIPALSIEFWLALPQTLRPTLPAAPDSPTNRQLEFTTPTKPDGIPPSPLRHAADIAMMTPTELKSIGRSSGTDTLTDYAADCYHLLSSRQLKRLARRSTKSADSFSSPRMAAVLASSGTSGFSYFGSLEFLDFQSAFDITFPNPSPLVATTTSSSGLSLDFASIPVSITAFVDSCKFQLFVPLFRTDYVGHAARDDAASLHATVQAIKKLGMTSRHPQSSHWINLTPDELYAEYSDLTPLLPSNVSLWGLNLVTQFFDALTQDLQDMLSTDASYQPPDLSSLTSRSAQLHALRTLRVAAVHHYHLFKAQEKLIAKTVLRKLKQGPAANTALAAPTTVSTLPSTRTFLSPAEETMRRYSSAGTTPEFPTDPLTNFQSTYPIGFNGCMFCGVPDHVFRSCPQNEAPGASAIFYKHLFAHKPHLRKRAPLPTDILPAPATTSPAPATQSFPTPTIPILAAPPLPSGPSPAAEPPPSAGPPPGPPPLPPTTDPLLPSGFKRARFFVNYVKSFPTHTSPLRPALAPMPIAIDNGLPHISFALGSDSHLDPSLNGLMDTCGALNTGYLLYHLWLMSERPDLVAEFVSFDDSNPFEPIKLGGAIRDPDDFDASDHGNLTAVVRYYTPYTDISGSSITVSFALGSDVTVNTIFGLPMLCDLDSVISLRTNSLHSRALNVDFPITRAAAAFGLPFGCVFDPDSTARNHASTRGLPSAASLSLPLAGPLTPTLVTAVDDSSLGFLQRTVHSSA